MKKIRTEGVDWNEVYKQAEGHIWQPSPHLYTREAAVLGKGGLALDIGCGEGHDAIYLAGQGYLVTALDISPAVLDGVKINALTTGVAIDVETVDATSLMLVENYNLIISYGFLHFAGKDGHHGYIAHLKKHTVPRGIHAFYTFGDVGNFHHIGKHKYWFPSQDSMQKIYHDWDILKLEEKTIKTLIKGDRGEDLYNSLIKIIVRKR